MPIFTVPVDSVRNTRIYASASESQPNIQLTIFKNDVDCHYGGCHMILPVPYPRTVRFHPPPVHPPNVSPYLNFLERVEQAFDSSERDRFRPTPPRFYPNAIGRYEVVEVLDSIRELRELNRREVILHQDTLDELADIYYQPHWGFILIKILEGDFDYEPICYSHRMLFDQLYVPSMTHQPRNFQDFHIPEEFDRFDDRYFFNGCSSPHIQSRRIQEVNHSRIHTIPWQTLPRDFGRCIPLFLSETRRGFHSNRDLLYEKNEDLDRRHRYSPERRRSISPWDIPRPRTPSWDL